MKLPPWSELKEGRGCTMCPPRADVSPFHYFVCKLSVSSLYLARNQVYRGTCAIIYDLSHVTRLGELPLPVAQSYLADLWVCERAIYSVLRPDHINIETLGNAVPHLHTHIIPRYRTDARWGAPIWTTNLADMTKADASDSECASLAAQLREKVASVA